MSDILLAVAVISFFLLVGAVFAAAEIALVSLRESQVRAMAERGPRGERVAKLYADPNLFLAAVQIGVTTAGFLSAAFGEATIGRRVQPVVEGWGVPPGVADVGSTIVITLVIAYFSIVFSELAPKRLALQHSEKVAWALAPVLDRIAQFLRPAVWLLSKSSDIVVRLVGGDPAQSRDTMTEEELREIVAGHESLSGDERQLIDEVFAAGDRQIREIMLPRTEVEFLDAALTVGKAVRAVAGSSYSRYPVVRGSFDDVVGFVHVRDLFNPDVRPTQRLGDIVRPVEMLPATVHVLRALSEMRRDAQHLAIVVDEYGGTAGIVTLEDLIEELIGDIHDEYDVRGTAARRLLTGETEVDGLLNLDEFAEETGLVLPDGPYETAAGYVMAALGRLPVVGDVAAAPGARLTVVALDGRRVSRLRVTPEHPEDDNGDGTPGDTAAGAADAGVGSVPDRTADAVAAEAEATAAGDAGDGAGTDARAEAGAEADAAAEAGDGTRPTDRADQRQG